MTKVFNLILLLLTIHLNLKAQWTSSGVNLYSNGQLVGINTSTPTTNLEVRSTTNPAVNISTSATNFLQLGVNTTAGKFCKFASIGDATIINRSLTTGDLILGTSLTTTPSSQIHGAIRFVTSSSSNSGDTERLTILNNGKVLIGTTDINQPADGLLFVNGKIYATAVKIELAPNNRFPDYVFEKNYKLMSLSDTKAYIEKFKHLPEIPSASDVKKSGGIDIAEMDVLLLKKVEELTLHMIQLYEKQIELKNRLERLNINKK